MDFGMFFDYISCVWKSSFNFDTDNNFFLIGRLFQVVYGEIFLSKASFYTRTVAKFVPVFMGLVCLAVVLSVKVIPSLSLPYNQALKHLFASIFISVSLALELLPNLLQFFS